VVKPVWFFGEITVRIFSAGILHDFTIQESVQKIMQGLPKWDDRPNKQRFSFGSGASGASGASLEPLWVPPLAGTGGSSLSHPVVSSGIQWHPQHSPTPQPHH
jgi:hypothetical protein